MTLVEAIELVAGGGLIVGVGVWRWNVDRVRANAMREANLDADAEVVEELEMLDLASRKAVAKKPAVSPYRKPQAAEGDMPPLPMPEPEPRAVTVSVKVAPATSGGSRKMTYRDSQDHTYYEVSRYLCARCGTQFVSRLDPTEIDIYDHCAVCKEKAVYRR